jgi:predicted nucleic acid-binding protein
MSEPTNRVVVADTSSLVFAHVIDPDLLRKLYERVLVPQPVWEEVDLGLRGGEPGPDVPSTGWMEIRPVGIAPAVHAADRTLGRGEAAVLSLALSLAPAQEAFALLDDRRGVRAATALRIPHTGMLGVLLAAKERGLVGEIAPLIARLNAAGFWVSPKVVRLVLARAGER